MWPLSFKQVRKKVKEYGKKGAKDTGLAFLEFSGDPDSSDSEAETGDQIEEVIPEPKIEEY